MEDPGDAELVGTAFEAEGLGYTIVKVRTSGDFDNALSTRSFELVLAGAWRGGLDPFETLRTTRNQRPELPVVFLSGVRSQELAVELMKAGACDFVSKHRLIDLVPAVRRAVSEAAELREALQTEGYEVLEAASAEDARALAERHAGAIDLMVTDSVPLERTVRSSRASSRPAMKVLFVSGYTDDEALRGGLLTDGQAFLQKPFALDVLAGRVRDLLDREAAVPI